MKILKKVINIILIFAIIQGVGMAFTSNKTYADGFFQNVIDQGRAYHSMSESGSQELADNSTEVLDTLNGIKLSVKAICAGFILVYMVITFIRLKGDNGAEKAEAKQTIVVIVILLVVFIFSDKIIDAVANMADSFQNMS